MYSLLFILSSPITVLLILLCVYVNFLCKTHKPVVLIAADCALHENLPQHLHKPQIPSCSYIDNVRRRHCMH